jgi:hypothetical protein
MAIARAATPIEPALLPVGFAATEELVVTRLPEPVEVDFEITVVPLETIVLKRVNEVVVALEANSVATGRSLRRIDVVVPLAVAADELVTVAM